MWGLDDRWPELGIRRWGDVLVRRHPEVDYIDEDDSYAESRESHRIHELRGLIMAQVAEIEDLLYWLVNNYLPLFKPLTPRQIESLKKVPAGALLKHAGEVLAILELEAEFVRQVAEVEKAIRRRNVLVHATVHVGFSYSSFRDQHEAVIVLLTSKVSGVGTEEIGELELEQDIRQAYIALDAAVDIWEAVSNNRTAAMLYEQHMTALRVERSLVDEEPPF